MKKTIFFFMASMILFNNMPYAEVSDKKPAIEKKEEASQLVQKGNKSFGAQLYDDAITYYKQAIALDPGSLDAHYDLGVTYGKKGMLDESIAAYAKVITIDPHNAQAYNNLGAAYEKKGMLNDADSSYEKAVAADPNLAPAQYNLGKSYLSKGMKSLAAEHLHKAGLLFLKSSNREWALKSLDLLKLTNSKELEKDLYEKLNPSPKDQEKKDKKSEGR